jgi:hypothetical protein
MSRIRGNDSDLLYNDVSALNGGGEQSWIAAWQLGRARLAVGTLLVSFVLVVILYVFPLVLGKENSDDMIMISD